jgi:dihydrofolate reductase
MILFKVFPLIRYPFRLLFGRFCSIWQPSKDSWRCRPTPLISKFLQSCPAVARQQALGKDICLIGGGELAQSLLAEGLVDRIGLNIHPILLGAGIPTFRDPGHRVKLALTEFRQLEGGCILAQYEVLRAR